MIRGCWLFDSTWRQIVASNESKASESWKREEAMNGAHQPQDYQIAAKMPHHQAPQIITFARLRRWQVIMHAKRFLLLRRRGRETWSRVIDFNSSAARRFSFRFRFFTFDIGRRDIQNIVERLETVERLQRSRLQRIVAMIFNFSPHRRAPSGISA